jgi:hypothetical protein
MPASGTTYMAFDINTLIVLIALWELLWKGLALWTSARKEQKYWFVAILFLNTVGILPILYLLFFKKKEISVKVHSELSKLAEKIPEMKVKEKKAKAKKPAKKKKK